MNESYPLKREQIADKVWFGSIFDSRFKTNLLSMNLVLPLNRETVTQNALIPQVLEKAFRLYPTYRSFSVKLNSLYGASVHTGITKLGDNEVLTFSVSSIDDSYALGGEALLEECAGILSGILLDPVRKDGLLDEENVGLQKQYLIDSIQAEINEKRSYALAKTIAMMFENDPYGLRKFGYLEDAQEITAKSATLAYERIKNDAHIEIIHVGMGNPEPAKRVFSSAFGSLKRTPGELLKTTPAVAREGGPKEATEYKKIAQSKLCLGFKTGVTATHPMLNPMRLMNAILGGSPTSKLFTNVREKLSLCYYCSSRIDRTKGLFLIDSGVEKDKVEAAKEAILAELQAVREQKITDDEFSYAKLSIQNTFRSMGESTYALESYYLAQTLLGIRETPFEQCEKLERVTKEEVAEAAGLVKLDTVYLLTGEENGEGDASDE